jgi:hypothetical protein
LYFSLIVGIGCWFKYQANRSSVLKEFPNILTTVEEERNYTEESRLRWISESKKTYSRIALGALAIGIYGGIWSPYQSNKEAERQYETYLASFVDGWNEYCDEIFNPSMSAISVDGTLYAGNGSYNGSWCKGLLSENLAVESAISENVRGMAPYSSVDYARDKGASAGYNKSIDAVFSAVPYLCYGTECISKDSEISRMEDLGRSEWNNQDWSGMYDTN